MRSAVLERVYPNQADDRQVIARGYADLLRTLRDKMDKEDEKNIRDAYEMAVEAHRAQRRKSGEPYITHPIEVARICVEEIGLGPTAVICALLHDVVEDTDISLKQIHDRFGLKVAKIVDGLTKLDASYMENDEATPDSPQAENFKKVLSTLVEDVRVALIKMADRLHNMRTLGSMPRHKQLKIAAETSYIYAPLAHRLGLYNFKTEYQDLCMKITDQVTYKEIARKLKETKRSREAYIQRFIEPLREEMDEMGVPYRILGRPKSIYSIWNKIRNKKVAFEEIYDLFAVRIILDLPGLKQKKEKDKCWLVYSTITDIYKPIPERLKDWVTTPKANGYESLHTTVIGPDGRFVEVQIRSERMDEICERGFAAHWKYKNVSAQPDVFDNWLDNIRDILDNPNANAQEFINDIKTNLFSEEVYVFTPKGDMIVLPKGATALDFAFQIHSEVGYHATAIKVNQKLVRMGYKLNNGDQISVTTRENQKPTEGWLKWVVTGKARSKIRSSMKEERRKQGDLGRETMQRKLKNLKVDFEPAMDFIVKHLNYNSWVDLFYDVATESVSTQDILRHFEAEGNKLVYLLPIEKKAEQRHKIPERGTRRVFKNPKLLIGGEPADSYGYSFATCCNAVLGDDIFAYITISNGVKIHRSNCPNAVNLLANYGYRVLKAEWVSGGNDEFLANLVITGVDEGVGVIQELTTQISSESGVNIRSFSISGNQGYFEGKLSILVRNSDELAIIIRKLQNLDMVSRVVREE